jgi:pimeloyl-[acyl-carrier protein] methyl ester esterase
MNPAAAVALVHGWGMNPAVWDPLAAELPGLRLTALALPGHGDDRDDASEATLAQWAHQLLERAPAHAVWVGWSLGGLVALRAALLQPERVRALLLVAATPRFRGGADWPAGLAPELIDGFVAELERHPEATLQRFLALQVLGAQRSRGVLRTLEALVQSRPRPSLSALRTGLGILRDADLRAELPRLRVPSHWIWGGGDRIVAVAQAEAVQHLLPGAGMEQLPGAGHAIPLTRPGALAAMVERVTAGEY